MSIPSSILACIGRTPIVRLSQIGSKSPIPILAKCEFLNPGGSVKDRIALAIIDDAETRGLLRPGMTLVEATAGNTGVGLALVAAIRGYKLACVMPEKMSHDKRTALAALGAEIIVTPNAKPDDPNNFVNTAKRLSIERGWFLADQFEHPANPRSHEQTTGPEILEQCGGKVGAFVCGVGTGGTITGVGRSLKSRLPNVQIVLADPVGSRLAHLVEPSRHPDVDAAYQVEGIGGSRVPGVLDLSVVDSAELIGDEESFAMTRRLWKEEGLLVGGSSGTAVAAAMRVAERRDLNGPVVVLLPDSWDRYWSKEWVAESGRKIRYNAFEGEQE